jgi:hypothetical protein
MLGATYAAYMLFFVVGGGAPLFHRARDISFEVLVSRRLYAIEFWVIIGGLGLYLAVTEMLPRKMSLKQTGEQLSNPDSQGPTPAGR